MKKKSIFSLALLLFTTFVKPQLSTARSSYLSITDSNSFLQTSSAKPLVYSNPEASSYLQGAIGKYMSSVGDIWQTKDMYLAILTGTIALAMADSMLYSFTRSK